LREDERFRSLEALIGPVSRGTFEALLAFEQSLDRWADRINLVGPETRRDLWKRHILDSAQLLSLRPAARSWLDLGSGAGFPGAVLAILLRSRTNVAVHLVESNRKKTAFLTHALAGLAPAAMVHAVRIEDAPVLVPQVDCVTARALAPLPRLLALAQPWLSREAIGLFHKGRDYQYELRESRDAWFFDLVEHRSRIDASGVILEISALMPRTRNNTGGETSGIAS
jgi:16S rRNA (guanine527-N7)-methyltransferase